MEEIEVLLRAQKGREGESMKRRSNEGAFEGEKFNMLSEGKISKKYI